VLGGKLTLTSGEYTLPMNGHQFIVFIAFALAISTPSQAIACRVGGDKQLFVERPSADALPGAEIIQVRFSNVQPRKDHWPTDDGNIFGKSYVGAAQLVENEVTNTDPFPVYAFVSSCSVFWGSTGNGRGKIIEGEYYLIGRFHYENGERRFYAGGFRYHGGGPIYEGWHI
jgi:hypothetical protein